MFANDSRIEHVSNGIRFYEQDVAMCDYSFTEEKLDINLKIDYLSPGFGIVLMQESRNPNTDTSIAYLFKLGVNSFKVYKRANQEISNVWTEACIFAPNENKLNQPLRFTINKRSISLVLVDGDRSKRQIIDLPLGSYKIKKTLQEYKVGIYSSAGNIVHDISFDSNVPDKWMKSIANVNGGRMSFFEDGFLFEECEHDAELEQKDILLKAGRYYLGYDTEEINGKFDIKSYIFPSHLNKDNVTDTDLEDMPSSSPGDWSDMMGFYYIRQLYNLLDNGDNIPCAIVKIASTSSGDERFDKMANELVSRFEPKETLYSATRYFWKIFSPRMRSAIQATEQTGNITYLRDIINEERDRYKQLLQPDNSFTIDKDGYVSLKFKGRSGKIKNVYIKKENDGKYVRTKDKPILSDGSWIAIPLKDIKSVKWAGTVYRVPEWTDFSKPRPYSIIGLTDTDNIRNRDFEEHPNYSMDEVGIQLGKKYYYDYDKEYGKLTVSVKEHGAGNTIEITTSDSESLIIFHSVDAVITDISITDKHDRIIDGVDVNGIHAYVPQSINSPIIVTLDDEPLELSSSYRELVIPEKKILSFSRSFPIELPERIVPILHAPELYGILPGNKIYPKKKTIGEFAPDSVRLDNSEYIVSGRSIKIPKKIRDKYSYIVVTYNSTEKYCYLFTTSAREIFDTSSNDFVFNHQCVNKENNIILYGIEKDAIIDKDKLFRIYSINELNAITLYADKYKLISHSKYKYSADTNSIVIDDDIKKQYKGFVADYNMDLAYAINYNGDLGQYEVDTSFGADSSEIKIIYDMQDNGVVSDYINTGINADKNKYIMLRRKG